jgi:hypothetical protein
MNADWLTSHRTPIKLEASVSGLSLPTGLDNPWDDCERCYERRTPLLH